MRRPPVSQADRDYEVKASDFKDKKAKAEWVRLETDSLGFYRCPAPCGGCLLQEQKHWVCALCERHFVMGATK